MRDSNPCNLASLMACIGLIIDLQFLVPRPWIEEELKKRMQERPRRLMWIRGHQGTTGNEEADKRANLEVEMGRRMHQPDIATPAGIKRAYHIHPKAPAHLRWSTRAIKGLAYMDTDKRPQRQWVKEMGKTEVPWCVCDGWAPRMQHTSSAVHGLETGRDGRGNRCGGTRSGVSRWQI